MNLEIKARELRRNPDPFESDLLRHARDRDAWVHEARKLHYGIRDFAALSALPGPACWYPDEERRGSTRGARR